MTIHTQIGLEHNTETHTHKMTLTDRHTEKIMGQLDEIGWNKDTSYQDRK